LILLPIFVANRRLADLGCMGYSIDDTLKDEEVEQIRKDMVGSRRLDIISVVTLLKKLKFSIG